MPSSLFAKERSVGIDIGSRLIKLVEIESSPKGWTVASASVGPTPKDAVKDGIIINVVEVSEQIRTMLRDSGSRATSSVMAISGSQVIVRSVKAPKMPEEKLRKSIKFEAARYVSASVENSVVEFEILGDAAESGQMNVMVVAAPQDMIDSRVRVSEASGLEPLVVDIESFSLIRSLVDFNSTDQYLSRTTAIVDMGAAHTDVNIVNKGEFALTRSIPIAGDAFTNAIKAGVAGSFEEAEEIKLDLGLKYPIDSPEISDPTNRGWRAVQPVLDELIREIRRSVNYYQSQFPENHTDSMIDKIVLTGGSSRIPGLERYVSSLLGIQTTKAGIFGQTAVLPGRLTQAFVDEYSPVLGVAVGLGLRECMSEERK